MGDKLHKGKIYRDTRDVVYWRCAKIMKWTDRKTNSGGLTQVGELRNILTRIKKKRWKINDHVQCHRNILHRILM